MKIFKGSKSITECDNYTYSGCRIEREISVCGFDTHNIGQLEKITTDKVLLLLHIGPWRLLCTHNIEKLASTRKFTTILLYGLNTMPLSFIRCRYQHILLTVIICDTLVLCVNYAHRITSNEISVLVFDVRYNIILMVEAYDLVQYLLDSGPF